MAIHAAAGVGRWAVGVWEVSLWPKVEAGLGAGDEIFAPGLNWLKTIPAIKIQTNDVNNAPELRLYTYMPNESAK